MGLLEMLHGLIDGVKDGDGERRAAGRSTDDPLRRYADQWEEVDRGMGSYVVYPPEDSPSSIRRCETLAEVRQRLEHWYEDK